MSQRALTVSLAAILTVLYGILFILQYQLFQSGSPDFRQRLDNVLTYAEQGDWNKSQEEAKQVERIWSKGQIVIAIKYADTSYTMLNVALARLLGAVKEKDLHSVRVDTLESKALYDNITSLSPRSP
ncbi:DUF4363 family protein [Paenibacillus sp. GCM10023252]|uniref:DUF4363 family protein n=1 Tax=Paenibacillus sp. GCM10023252 TaxID=3252649 RepID=UPI00360857E2